MNTKGTVVAVVVVAAASVFVALLPTILQYTFSPTDSAVLGLSLLCVLLVFLFWIMRRVPTKWLETLLFCVLCFLPFGYFVLDAAASALDVQTNITIGVVTVVWLALSLNLETKEISNAPALLGIWTSCIGFAGHVCLAFGWRSDNHNAVFWVILVLLLLFFLVISCCMMCCRKRWKKQLANIGLTWPRFDKFKVFVIILENLAVLSLSQTIDHGAKSVFVPILALFLAVFWGMVLLDSLFRIFWRLSKPYAPSKHSNLNLVLSVAGVGCLVLGTFWGFATWLCLVGAVFVLLYGNKQVRTDRFLHKTKTFDLFSLGIVVTTASTTVAINWGNTSITVFALASVALGLFLLVQLAWNRSFVCWLFEGYFYVVWAVFASSSMWVDDFVRGSYGLIGILALMWTVYWFFALVTETPAERTNLLGFSALAAVVLWFVLVMVSFWGVNENVISLLMGLAVGATFVFVVASYLSFSKLQRNIRGDL